MPRSAAKDSLINDLDSIDKSSKKLLICCQPALDLCYHHHEDQLIPGAQLAKGYAMATHAILRRLRSLRNWEAFNVLFLPLILGWMAYRAELPTWFLYTYVLLMVSYVLAQGSLYWHLKLQALCRNQRTLPANFFPLFRFFKWSNLVLILSFPAIVLVALAIEQTGASEILRSTLLFFFVLLEYINYYHYQLMHDSRNDWSYLLRHRKLRMAPLAQDLAQTKRFQAQNATSAQRRGTR